MSNSSGINILYIEDNESLSRLIHTRLTRYGYNVTIARDGKNGLSIYDKGNFDLLIVDHEMPGYTGIEVIRIIASRFQGETDAEIGEEGESNGKEGGVDKGNNFQDEPGAEIEDGGRNYRISQPSKGETGGLPPIIMVTGAGSEEIAVEAMKLGADDYIVKDQEGNYLELLPSVIEKALRRYSLVEEKKRAELNLKLSEKEKIAILDGISEQVLYQDQYMNVLWVNEAVSRSVGSPVERLQGYRCHLIMHNSLEVCENCPIDLVHKTKKPREAEVTTPDGRIWMVRAYPVLDDGGEITGVVEFRMEITARKLAEESISDTKEMYQSLLWNARDMIFRYRFFPVKGYEYVSPASKEITGYSPEEFYIDVDLFRDIVHPEDRHLIEKYSPIPGTNAARPIRLRWITTKGEVKWVEQHIVPIYEDGNPLDFKGMGIDSLVLFPKPTFVGKDGQKEPARGLIAIEGIAREYHGSPVVEDK